MVGKLNNNQEEKREIQKSLNFFILNELENSELGSVKIKGSELKEKLLVHKGIYIHEISMCIRKMSKLVKEINIEPEKFDPDSSILTYNYNQIYSDNNKVINDNISDVEIEHEDKIDDKEEKMREYNNHVYKLRNYKKELMFLNNMIENIKENKEYNLPLRVVTHLGIDKDDN